MAFFNSAVGVLQTLVVASPCQIHKHNAVTFDTKLNLLPCDMYFVNKIGKLGTDFNTAEEFVAWREKQPYKKVIEEIDQLPSDKCKQCKDKCITIISTGYTLIIRG